MGFIEGKPTRSSLDQAYRVGSTITVRPAIGSRFGPVAITDLGGETLSVSGELLSTSGNLTAIASGGAALIGDGDHDFGLGVQVGAQVQATTGLVAIVAGGTSPDLPTTGISINAIVGSGSINIEAEDPINGAMLVSAATNIMIQALGGPASIVASDVTTGTLSLLAAGGVVTIGATNATTGAVSIVADGPGITLAASSATDGYIRSVTGGRFPATDLGYIVSCGSGGISLDATDATDGYAHLTSAGVDGSGRGIRLRAALGAVVVEALESTGDIFLSAGSSATVEVTPHLRMKGLGSSTDVYLFIDDTVSPPRLRMHTSAPTSATDGVVVGTQS